MSFDPSTVATQLAALQARCDFQQFSVSITTTKQTSNGHPFQGFFTPTTNSVVALQWNGVYRGLPRTQPALFADTSRQTQAEAALLTAANDFLNQLDLQADALGDNPNPYKAGSGGANAT